MQKKAKKRELRETSISDLKKLKEDSKPFKQKTILVSQWYWPKDSRRTSELIKALDLNLRNPFVDEIHLLQPTVNSNKVLSKKEKKKVNDDNYGVKNWNLNQMKNNFVQLKSNFSINLFRKKVKLSTVLGEGRLQASDAFNYSSTMLRGHIVVLHNLDIYFDKTLALIRPPKSDLNYMTSYFLSRYEEEDNEAKSMIGTQCGKSFIGSHDAIVFIPPLPKRLVERCNFELGSWGIENRLLWEFERFGIKGRNPCEDIKIWHSHSSQYKSSWMPQINTDGRSSVAFPDKLVSKFKSDFPWDLAREVVEREAVQVRAKGKKYKPNLDIDKKK
ncbi:hypothetical protein HK099_007197 [Clydaea vesicula]|uniref:Uncharacterized protein n=1 Tax=Clydaea vesicula TaxID=447962 RepID=A0AAD5XTV3_9FUNG|nr:hypothetical protein HK099_007197 [Clydaea vesicula]